MKIIVGLGNPGDKYKNTRHNFGFMLIDALAEKLNVSFKAKKRLEAEIAEVGVGDERIILSKPQTFMNNSGKAVKKILDFYQLSAKDLLVIYDDLDLPLGTIKTSGKSSAGHKGVESILDILKSTEFSRIRLGIGKNEHIPSESYVLSPFGEPERAEVDTVTSKVIADF